MQGQAGIEIKTRDWLALPQVRRVMDVLNTQTGAARFVGGCVRDALLGHPVHDIDIATSHAPEVVVDLLEKAGIKVIPTGLKHGTVTAVMGQRHFEITTLRRDVETFGRHATVAYTDDWREDAFRRDFTINALYMDFDGTLYDPSGEGLADLQAGHVRFIGAARDRIAEDALRILRFFRFTGRFCADQPDVEGLAACAEMAGALELLSGERLLQESLKILVTPRAVDVLQMMQDEGVLSHVLPQPYALDVLRHLIGLENTLGMDDSERRLGALLSEGVGIHHPMVEYLKLSKRQQKRLQVMRDVARHKPLAMTAQAARAAIYRLGADGYTDGLLLSWAQAGRDPQDKNAHALLQQAKTWQAPVFPLRGDDLKALGMSSGPEMGAVMTHVETWWIEADFAPGHAALIAQAKKLLS